MQRSPRYEYNRVWRIEHAADVHRRNVEYGKAHPRHGYKSAWRAAHKVSVRATNQRQYKKSRSKILAHEKLYREKNRQRIKKRMAEYHRRTYPLNRERLLVQTKAYAQSHPEVRARIHQNRKRNCPEEYRAEVKARNVRRKARIRGALCESSRLVTAIIRKWRLQPTFTCYYCRRNFLTALLEVDHIVPISKGGKHSPDNICRSCPKCNHSKQAKSISELAPAGQTLLSL